MALCFFAGIAKLNVLNVHSVFTKELWEYDNHVHTCHLLYEADSGSLFLCSYVANNVLERELHIGLDKYSRFNERTEYSNLMICKFPCV